MAKARVIQPVLNWITSALVALVISGVIVLPALALSPPPGTIISNQATATYSAPNGYVFAPVRSNTVTTEISSGARLQVSVSASSDPVAQGDGLTYTITVTNSGNLQSSGTTASAKLSDNLVFQSASDGGIFSPGGTVIWNLGAIPAAGTLTVTLSSTVKNGAVTIPFSVTAAAAGVPAVSTSLVTGVGSAPNLTIADTASASIVYPGGTITYTATYGNSGNAIANGVVITNELPSGTALEPGSITGGGTLAGRIITWPVGTVLTGGTGSVSFKTNVSPLAHPGDTIRNVSVIMNSVTAPVTSTPLIVLVTTPSLSISKTALTSVARPGGPLKYEITVKNDGGAAVSDIQLRDPAPAATSIVQAGSGGIISGREVNWGIPKLEPGATATVQLELLLDKSFSASFISNTAYVSAKGGSEISSRADKSVSARTPGRVEFIDSSGIGSRTVLQFKSGDNICVQVNDQDRNLDPFSEESVSVTVDHIIRVGGIENTDDSATVKLTENGKSSGVFQGCFPSNAGPPVTGDSTLSLGPDSTIRATYTDPLDATPISTASAFIDPFGIVFDSVTGNPVGNAVVRLIDDNTGLDAILPQPPLVPFTQDNPVVTSNDGRFQFQYMNPGRYRFLVTPKDKKSDFTFPTKVALADLPTSYLILNGSRGEVFELTAGMEPLNLDIPVDPPPGQLQLVKSSNKDTASIGDLVSYAVTVANLGKTGVTNLKIVDTMPHGVQYLKGSTMIAGSRGADPEYTGNGVISWTIGSVKPAESITISYMAAVGPDSRRGDGKNSARAYGKSAGADVVSNNAVKIIKISEGVFTSDGLIIGKVLLEDNKEPGGESRDGNTAKGVAGASLYMEDGTRVVTDSDGRFSISGVRPGTHLLRLDETSLPTGMVPVSGDNRFMGGDSSRFVDITSGGMHKANFSVQKSSLPPDAGKNLSATSVNSGKAAPSSVPVPSPDISGAILNPEKAVLDMTPELAFLNLSDGLLVHSTRIKFLVKTSPEALLTVLVNDRPVGPENIGKKITTKSTAIYEYVNVPLEAGGDNRIRLEARDPFGNLRESRTVTLLTSDTVSRLEIIPASREIPADGSTTVKITARILDKNGSLVLYPRHVTVSVSAGEIVDADADPAASGLQIPCRSGIAEFTVKAPFETVEARILVSYEDIERSAPLFFAPHLRSMMVVGMGEATLGYGRTSGAYTLLKRDTHIDRKVYLWGRGAFFLKGELWKGLLLTASFDSEKKKQEDFFRSDRRNLETEDKYPVYGDDSKTGYEALSREKLYVRVDKGRSFLLYGDYETGISGTRLSPYNRTVTGLKGGVVTDHLKITSFASYTDQTQVVDNLLAKGISGYYFLNRTALHGSERVVVETRDRQRIDRVLSRMVMSRWSDYTIDYDMGAILFNSPISSHDSNLNPVYIIVTYESRTGGSKYAVYGGRGVLKPADALELGVTGIVEQKGTIDYQLLGADVTFKLPGNSTVKLEISQTNSGFDINNGLTRKSGKAWGVEVDFSPLPLLSLSAYYRDISDYFDNPSASDSMRGTRKYGVEGKYSLASFMQFKGKFFNEKDTLNNTKHTLASFGIEKKYRKSRFGLEVIRETSTDRYIPVTNSTSRGPFDIASEAARDMTAVRVSGEAPLVEDLSATVSHLQDVQRNRHNVSQIGLNYQLNKQQRLYVKEEFAKYEERNESRTVFGGESFVGKNTVAFEEYRLASGADGRRGQQSIGLRNKFSLAHNITGNLSIEKLSTIRGRKNSSEPDAFATAAGIEFLPVSFLKITSRLEYRQEFSLRPQNSWLGELKAACKLHQDYTLIFSERYFYNEFKYEGERITTRTAIGLAYRPVMHDRFNALAKVELKHEENSIRPQNTVSDAYIFSAEGIFQATPSVQIFGKYAGKMTVENGFNAYTDFYSGRLLYDLTRKIDLGAEYRMLTSHATGSVHHGGTVEAGYRVVDNLWFSAGYSFDSFDADLAGDSYTGEGPFIRVRVKFDEVSLKKMFKTVSNN